MAYSKTASLSCPAVMAVQIWIGFNYIDSINVNSESISRKHLTHNCANLCVFIHAVNMRCVCVCTS